MKKALIVVDVQKDFVENGALAVNGGYKIADRIYTYLEKWAHIYNTIVFTKDWHNSLPDTNGGHFSETPDYVDSWPVHCVAGTEGAEFATPIQFAWEDLFLNGVINQDNLFYKGQGKPDYSGFQGFNRGNEALHRFLIARLIEQVDVVGIAGDHCVKATAIDAKAFEFEVNILPDLVASVGGDIATATTIKQL